MAVLQSDSITELSKALAAAQAELTAPPKDKTAKVPTKAGKEYSYKYSDLATVIETVKPILPKHGLSVTQTTDFEGNTFFLVTTLQHSSGQWRGGRFPLPGNLTPQEFGSWMTYLRRYTLCAILGIASDEDTDAKEAEPDDGIGNADGGTKPNITPRPQNQGPAPGGGGTVAPPKGECGHNWVPSRYSGYYCTLCKASRRS